MTFKEKIFAALGDTWFSGKSVALWPWPAVVLEWPKTTLTWDDYRAVTLDIRPGDIILSREDAFFFSNGAIPGEFKHVAVYTGSTLGIANRDTRTITPHPSGRMYERTIVHAVSEGVICQDFGELFFNCDAMVVVRPWRTPEEQKAIVAAAFDQVGKPYDFNFDPDREDVFYCSKLGAVCIRRAGITPPPMVFIPKDTLAFIFHQKSRTKLAYIADRFLEVYPIIRHVGDDI